MARMSSFGPLSGPVSQSAAHASPAASSAPLTKLDPTKLDPTKLNPRKSPIAPTPTTLPEPVVPWITDTLLKHRKLLIALALIPLIVSFNGRWRMGLDSSIYRGLGRSLATGNGYHFGEFGTHQVYPGLPVLLAGITKIFGENVYRPVPTLVLM